MKTLNEFYPSQGNKPRLTALFASAFFLILALPFTGCKSGGDEAVYEGDADRNSSITPDLSARTPVKFMGVNADGTKDTHTTTVLALHFNMEISGLDTADIRLTNTGETGALRGTLSGNGPTYMLTVNGIKTGGEITVTVAKTGYDIQHGSWDVTVHYGKSAQKTATFTGLKANGGIDKQATSELTLEFKEAIKLDAKDIIFNPGATGASWTGTLGTTGSDKTYTLPVTGIKKTAKVSVTVNKEGYTFTSGPTKSVMIFDGKYMPVNDLDLTDSIPVPVEGETPVSGPVPEFSPTQYSVKSVVWYNADNTFKPGAKYRARVTLAAKPGYIFTDDSADYLFHAEADLTSANVPAITSYRVGDTFVVDVTFRTLYKLPAIKQTWYVRYDGNDEKITEGDREHPLMTINEALERVKETDTSGWPGGASAEIVLLSGLTLTQFNPGIGPITDEHPPIILRSDPDASNLYTILMDDPKTIDDILLSVKAGGDLTLKDIILKYNGSGAENQIATVIMVEGTEGTDKKNQAHLTFESGVSFLNANEVGKAWGVRIDKNGVFTMNRGTISGIIGNTGGVSVVEATGSFVMNGGIIAGNTGIDDGGGGVHMDDGSFEMNGGVIEGNNSSTGGGGVRINGGKFTMNGGMIRNNTTGWGGAGVLNNGTFKMNGGLIKGNLADEYGGGVISGPDNPDGAYFIKTGGVIYGSDVADGLKNTAGNGNAVDISGKAWLNKTLGPKDNLDSNTTTDWSKWQ